MTMAKVQKISQTITSFGGINFINEEFSRCGLSQFIDNHLGYRQSTKGYKYSDIVRSWFNIFSFLILFFCIRMPKIAVF
jgi:hypothetical protein